MSDRKVFISGVGRCLPGEPVTNKTILEYCNLGITEEWARDKIGIEARHLAKDYPINESPLPRERWIFKGPRAGMSNSDNAAEACRAALKDANLLPSQVDLIVLGTCTPDYPIPSTATLVQDKLGIASCIAIDVRAACTGSTLAISIARQHLELGEAMVALVIGSEVGSVFGSLDKDADLFFTKGDAVNAMMIGDGAAAFVLEFKSLEELSQRKKQMGPSAVFELINVKNRSIGLGKAPGMYLPIGGSMHPVNRETANTKLTKFQHDFTEVLKHGPQLYSTAMDDALKTCNKGLTDFAVYVPHQANGKIAELGGALGLPTPHIFINFSSVGNCANASVPLCLVDLLYPRPGVKYDSPDKLLLRNQPNGALIVLLTAESTKWLYGWAVLKYIRINEEGSNIVSKSQYSLLTRLRYSIHFTLMKGLLSVRAAFISIFGTKRRPY